MSSKHRDYQKSRLYAWENKVVGPRCPRIIKFRDAQAFVDGIFICEGLVGAPRVALMPKQATRIWATGSRGELRIRPETPAWVIVHELAHAMTMSHDESVEGHGPDYVGVYIKLLDKYLALPLALTMYSLQFEKIKYNLAAAPRFSDHAERKSA
jgi:hypothetical protein